MKTFDPPLETRIQHFVEACRKGGVSVTPQRVLIFKSLASTDSHPTADEIYSGIKKELPTVSLATVYKTLETFERLGFISKTRVTGERARFDANREHHHHLICKRCGLIADIYDQALHRTLSHEKMRSGFRVEQYRIDFFGVCKNCRQQPEKRKS
ncbi:MAG TPA: transcriptional repressor [bacterium]|nr:transcriptional repressor [bacterium]